MMCIESLSFQPVSAALRPRARRYRKSEGGAPLRGVAGHKVGNAPQKGAAPPRKGRPWVKTRVDQAFLTNSLIHSVVTVLGRSMGRPRARSQIRLASTPRARLTPKSTV